VDRLDSPSNPSIGAGAGDTGRINNAVVRARALDPIAAGTPDRNGDLFPLQATRALPEAGTGQVEPGPLRSAR
jgi:hypothetical protein